MSADRKTLRTFPLWLIEAGVSAEAILLWSCVSSLAKYGSRGVCDASVEFLAAQLPKRRGKELSPHVVRGLIQELVAAGALDIVTVPGHHNQYVPHRTPVARNLNLFSAAEPGARRAAAPRPKPLPAAVASEALADSAPASESEGLARPGAHPGQAPTLQTPRLSGGHPSNFPGGPLKKIGGTPQLSEEGHFAQVASVHVDAELSTAPSTVVSTEGSTEKKGPPPPIAHGAGGVTVDIEVQRIFVAYGHAIRDLGPTIAELRKASGDRRPPPGILRPRDRAAAAQAAGLGTCHRLSNEALREEFRRTALGLLRARRTDGGVGYDPTLTALLNHIGEAWAEERGQRYPSGEDVDARIAELAEIAGLSVEEFRARHGRTAGGVTCG